MATATRHSIGIIGCGWFADFHMHGLQRLAGRARIAWVADLDLRKAERVAELCDAQALTDYRAQLADVDAVHILLPHHLHHPVTIACLEAGKHVLLEKPLALDLAQADDMIAVAEQTQCTLMVAYPHRYRNCMQVFRDAIVGGRYGRLFMLDGMMDESLKGYAGGWIAKKETLGGGVFFSSSPHMLDVMLWIGGDVTSIAMAGTHGGVEMEGEDTAVSILSFASGVVGVTRHTWASPSSRIWYTMQATCEEARITLTTTPVGDLFGDGPRCDWRTQVQVEDAAGNEILLDNHEGIDVEPEIAHFLDCIETGETPQTDGRAARRIIELCNDAYADAEKRGALS